MPRTKLILTCKNCGGYDDYDIRTNGQNSYLTHHTTSCSAVHKN